MEEVREPETAPETFAARQESENPTQTPSPDPVQESAEPDADPSADFRATAEEDLAILKQKFTETAGIDSLCALFNPKRYGELRELGLSPEEAYLASGSLPRAKSDNRSHLHSAVPRTVSSEDDGISLGEMDAARELFPGLSDGAIRRLYKKVIR